MRKQLLLFSALIAMSFNQTITAQNLIGYSDDNVHSQGTSFGNQQLQGVAIKFPLVKSKQLKGFTLKGIRTKLRTLSVKQITVFITKKLSEKPFYEETFTINSIKPIDLVFKKPQALDGQEFYIGYTTKTPNQMSKPLSFDSSFPFTIPNSYVLTDNNWDYKNCYNLGAAYLQLLVDNVKPFTDIILKPFEATGIFKSNHEYSFDCQAFNMGTDTIKELEISVQIGKSPKKTSIRQVNIAPNKNYTFKTDPYLITTSEKKQKIQISVQPIGKQDIDLQDNTSTNELGVLPSTYNRKILAEIFTSQKCGNCPNGESTWERASYNNKDLFIYVKHHVGFMPDRFSMQESNQIKDFYQVNGNPMIMLNRRHLVTNDIAFPAGSLDLDLKAIESILGEEAPLQISLKNTFNKKTKQGVLTVSIETFSKPSTNQHFLSIFLTQDSIRAFQSGSPLRNNYVHNDMLRKCLTAPLGEPIELKIGKQIVKTFNYTIPDKLPSTSGEEQFGPSLIECIPENMNWVVFVADKTETNKTSPVYNVAKIPVTEITQGLSSPLLNTPSICIKDNVLMILNDFSLANIYTLDGRKYTSLDNAHPYIQLEKGIYLIKVKLVSGQIIQKKIIIN